MILAKFEPNFPQNAKFGSGLLELPALNLRPKVFAKLHDSSFKNTQFSLRTHHVSDGSI